MMPVEEESDEGRRREREEERREPVQDTYTNFAVNFSLSIHT